MNLGHWLGSIKINSATIFDSHLVLIFFVAIFVLWLLFSGRKYVNTLKLENKTLLVRLSSVGILGLMSVFTLQFVMRNFADQENVSKFFVINNIDVLTASLFALSTLLGRHKLARAFLPLLLVFGGMRLINNPSVELDTLENSTMLLTMSLAVLIFVTNNKNLTVREMFIGQLVTIAIITYSFGFNSVAGTRFSTMSVVDVFKNPVYNWINSDVIKIALFFIIAATFEFTVWAIIRFSTNYVSDKSIVKAFKEIFKIDETSIRNFTYNVYEYLVSKEIFEVEEFREPNAELVTKTEEEIVLLDVPEYYLDFVLPALAVSTIKINAIRAPSL